MSKYCVFSYVLAGMETGAMVKDCTDLSAARQLAGSESKKAESGRWRRIFVYERIGSDKLKCLEHYYKDRKYSGGSDIS